MRSALRRPLPPGDDFVRVTLPLIASGGDAGIAAAAREHEKQAKVVDARLFRVVTLQEKGVALGDFCAELGAQVGVELRASRTVADEKVTVLVKRERARDVMRAVAQLFSFFWSRSGEEGGYRYELNQDLRSQLAEEELRNHDNDTALVALDAQMQKSRPHLGDSYEELERRWQHHELDRSVFEGANNGGWGGEQVYHRLTPAERAALVAGAELVFRPGPPDLDHTFPTEWQASILRSMKHGEETPGTTVDQIRLRLDRSEVGRFSLEVRTIYGWHTETEVAHSYLDTELAVGVNPSSVDIKNATANAVLRGQAPLGATITLHPKPSCRSLAHTRPQARGSEAGEPAATGDDAPDVFSADVWEAVHQQTGLPIVADFYSRQYPPVGVTTPRMSIFDALCKVGDAMGARWRKEGDFLLCRSAAYFWDKLKEVPNRHLRRWARDRDASDGLPLADFLQMATLSDQQLSSAPVGRSIQHCWGLGEWGFLNDSDRRRRARFLATLTPEQLQRTLQPGGLPFGKLSPQQQGAVFQLQMAAFGEMIREGSMPTPIPPELWAYASVTARYIPGHRYIWTPARSDPYAPAQPTAGATAEDALAAARRIYSGALIQQVAYSTDGHFEANVTFNAPTGRLSTRN